VAVAFYQVLYWREIPTQIRVSEPGKKNLVASMPGPFQEEIDRVAMAEGLTGTDAYLDQWHWSPRQERAGSQAEVLDAVMRELTAPRQATESAP
jgi:hypothetical protein